MTKKRYRKPNAKDGELLVKYGQEDGQKDLHYCYPENETRMSADSRIVMLAFESTNLINDKTLRKELEDRGYDITTLKFSIMKKEIEHFDDSQ